jgi:hypothetical protein
VLMEPMSDMGEKAGEGRRCEKAAGGG